MLLLGITVKKGYSSRMHLGLGLGGKRSDREWRGLQLRLEGNGALGNKDPDFAGGQACP